MQQGDVWLEVRRSTSSWCYKPSGYQSIESVLNRVEIRNRHLTLDNMLVLVSLSCCSCCRSQCVKLIWGSAFCKACQLSVVLLLFRKPKMLPQHLHDITIEHRAVMNAQWRAAIFYFRSHIKKNLILWEGIIFWYYFLCDCCLLILMSLLSLSLTEPGQVVNRTEKNPLPCRWPQHKRRTWWVLKTDWFIRLFLFSELAMIIFSVIAAIGYVLIGNGLYDEAIKHFSLLLQVCLNPFKLPNQHYADLYFL